MLFGENSSFTKNIGMRIIFLGILLIQVVCLNSQVLIDEYYEDWTSDNLRVIDNIGDVSAGKIDFNNLWVSNDEEYLFISLDLGKEINLQENNDLMLFIDFDNNVSTGEILNEIGVDLIYSFGDREGIMYIDGFLYFLSHNDIGLITQPTVSSERFEIGLKRSGSINGDDFSFGDNIKIYFEDDTSNGDKIPDQTGALSFSFDDSIQQNSPPFSYEKENPNFLRILCYNSLFDGLFESGQRDAQRRIIKAMNPDIIGFQEIYNHNANEVADVIEELLPITGEAQWYRAKIGPDIFVISKYPVIGIFPLDGNGAFRLDLGDKEMLMIVAHLPCCNNDQGRQDETDNIISFIRKAKDGTAGFTLPSASPIVIMGDMNLVGSRRQRETLVFGDIFNEIIYGPDIAPDWDGAPFIDARFYNTGQPTAATWFNAGSSFNPGRLDYIIYSGSAMSLENSFSVYTPTMSNTDLDNLGLNQFDSNVSSDHIALVADFELGLTSSTEWSTNKSFEFQLYPNPARQEIKVQLDWTVNEIRDVEFRILNSLGQLVLKKIYQITSGSNEIIINVSGLQDGIYSIELLSNNQGYRAPFIKH
jgi:endonuclease/exonuclease/phosphatase family metal-dependent hydrolase